ncbi:aminoglycoside phosphotransferase family protein [Streptomyces sp. NPDC002004]
MRQQPPTADDVHRIVRSVLGGTGAVPDVRPVHEGGEPYAWWVGSRHVLRLARDRAASAGQRRELRLRDLVRPHVGVPVPVSAGSGEWAPGLAFTLDRKLPGVAADERAVSAAGESDLATLLTGLRAVPVAQAATLGLPRVPARSLEALRAAATRAAGPLAADGEFDPARLAQPTPQALAQLAPGPAAFLVHHRLTGDRLRVTADGRVCGILDWSDALVGDPAEDIAGLARAVGAPAAVRAATLAGYGARDGLRGLWLARCDTVLRFAERLHGTVGTPLSLLRLQLRHAWEPILLERVTDLPEEDE